MKLICKVKSCLQIGIFFFFLFLQPFVSLLSKLDRGIEIDLEKRTTNMLFKSFFVVVFINLNRLLFYLTIDSLYCKFFFWARLGTILCPQDCLVSIKIHSSNVIQ